MKKIPLQFTSGVQVLVVVVCILGVTVVQVQGGNTDQETNSATCLEYCNGNFDGDGDADGKDIAIILADFGRTNCCEPDALPCEGDLNGDCDVNEADLGNFAVDFGRTDCPNRIEFTHVPDYPNPHGENLKGRVTGIDPAMHCVATFILVEGSWWTKPTFASPCRAIEEDGTWTVHITTGINDRYATDIAVFVLPQEDPPPTCGPCHELPEIPEAVVCAKKYIGPPVRIVSFEGYQWKVKRRDFPAGPGPNYFSDRVEDVWVDDQGLHLTINKRDGKWYSTEVILNASLGYGSYIFQTKARLDVIDPNMVFALFTWDDSASSEHYREMDIEFARWGNSSEHTNAQYVIQPCSLCPGCGSNCTRFRVDLTEAAQDLTHYMVWKPDSVEFRTYYGKHVANPPQNDLVYKWSATGELIPDAGTENVRSNFWLLRGRSPVSDQGDEAVITHFSWQEATPWPDPVIQVTTNLSNGSDYRLFSRRR